MRYYIQRDGNPLGPFTIEELKELLVIGSISKIDLAALEGTNDYRPLAEIMLENQSATVSITENQTPNQPIASSTGFSTNNYSEPPSSNYSSASFYEQPLSFQRKDLFATALELLKDNFFSWFAILLLPAITVIPCLIFTSKIIMQTLSLLKSIITDFTKINAEQIVQQLNPINFIIILGFLLLAYYLYICSRIMITSKVAIMETEGYISPFSTLFIQSQSKVLPFLAVNFIIFLINLLIGYAINSLLPIDEKIVTRLITALIQTFVLPKLIILLYAVILEDGSFIYNLSFGWKVAKGNYLRVFCYILTFNIITFITLISCFGQIFLPILIIFQNIIFTLLYLEIVKHHEFNENKSLTF
ncbi:MAG TPA: DUF4339 domain-containing protein [Bacillota bacterium]|nr:DUF4339 domain-containing protein [Bacillota bacterium]HOL10812.1 DUF4339 domain-containing protein [Bacillota bacterium]HPO96439.1 DUF4339 domain-containing protein [Bacillota bacterium]